MEVLFFASEVVPIETDDKETTGEGPRWNEIGLYVCACIRVCEGSSVNDREEVCLPAPRFRYSRRIVASPSLSAGYKIN